MTAKFGKACRKQKNKAPDKVAFIGNLKEADAKRIRDSKLHDKQFDKRFRRTSFIGQPPEPFVRKSLQSFDNVTDDLFIL